MKTTVRWVKKDDSAFLMTSVENAAGDEIYLLAGADRVFSEKGQELLEAVFGLVLANNIRATKDYQRCEYVYSQGQMEVF